MKIPSETIDNRNAGTIAEAGVAAIRGGDCSFDFSGVARCDSAALACVLAWKRAARQAGRTLSLLALPPELLSLARLYGVEQLLDAAGGH